MKNLFTLYKRISIRYKLLFLLVTLPTLSLGLYLVLAARIFEKDKMAYVYDSCSAISRGLAAQIRTETEGIVSAVSNVIQGYDPRKNTFNDFSKKIFYENTKLNSIRAYQFGNGVYNPFAKIISKSNSTLNMTTAPEKEFSDKAFIHLALSTGPHELGMRSSSDHKKMLLALKIGNSNDIRTMFVGVLANSPEFVEAFNASTNYLSYLVNYKGQVVLAPKSETKTITDFSKWDFFQKMKKNNSPEGVSETKNKDNKENFLVSFSRVGVGGYIVVSLISKAAAMQAVNILLIKSILFFVALISFAIMISVIAARKLTKPINELYKASQKVSQGDFGVQVESTSQDEIGALTDSFNHMSGKISSLLKESVDKARMEKELETAKTVQNMLFPESNFKFGKITGSGYYEPASECGGDWWNYSKIGKFIFIWLGDATGHGAAAALTTSAAKSAASVIERLPNITPAAAMDYLNNAIFDTSKGQMMMTFFLAAINTENGEMAYATASHDPPYLFKSKNAALTRQDVVLLQEKINPRLGETTEMKSEQCQLQLASGDYLIFYTDGVMATENNSKEKLGERNFISTTLEALNKKMEPNDVVTHISSKIREHRQQAALPDDVTVVVCRYQ